MPFPESGTRLNTPTAFRLDTCKCTFRGDPATGSASSIEEGAREGSNFSTGFHPYLLSKISEQARAATGKPRSAGGQAARRLCRFAIDAKVDFGFELGNLSHMAENANSTLTEIPCFEF